MEPSPQTEIQPEPPDESGQKRGRTLALLLGGVLVLALLVGGGYLLIINEDFTRVLRDIFIILLALETLVIGAFLLILIFQLQSLIVVLRDEVKPILDSANQTVSTVRGTTDFVSQTVISPIIKVSGTLSGLREAWRVVVGRPSRRAGKS